MVTITDVKVFPVKFDSKFLKANVQFTIDNTFILKATLMNGSKGMWLAYPGKSGEKVDENGKKPFYADIRCVDKEVSAKLFQQVMSEYNKKTGNKELDQSQKNESMDQSSSESIPY